MTTPTIHPAWLILLLIAVTACISLITLSVGLYLLSGRKEKRKTLPSKDETARPETQKTSGVMGAARQPERQSPPNTATKRQTEAPGEKSATFAREIPSGELDHVFGGETDYRADPDPDPDDDEVDLQDEEIELLAHRSTGGDEFAAGTTFGELRKTARLLQKPDLPADEQKIVRDLAARLQQTDLWDKFVDAIPQANEKIAKMLDTPLSEKHSPPDDWLSFDIRNFI